MRESVARERGLAPEDPGPYTKSIVGVGVGAAYMSLAAICLNPPLVAAGLVVGIVGAASAVVYNLIY
jgi:hypothetical protein